MARLYLHIGSEKTGSTALQHFLSMNSDRLGRDGLIYPCEKHQIVYSMRYRGHFPLVASFFPNLPDFVGKSEYHDNDKMLSSLKRIVESETLSIILSCEHFSSRLTSAHIKALSKALRAHEVIVIFYMRPQKDLIWSSYSTSVINGRRSRLCVESISIDDPYLNYYKMLEPWAESFGDKNIILRDYKNLVGGNIVDDFMWTLGVRDISLYIKKGFINKRMSPKEVEFIRRLNSHLPNYEEAGNLWHPHLVTFRKIIRHLSFLSSSNVNNDHSFSLDRASKIFDESNSELRQRYNNSLRGPHEELENYSL